MAGHNAEKYLGEAVDSILNQTFSDFELILIDDGSKDTTPQIVADYGRRDPRVVPISRPNKGIPKTQNEGLARVTAPLLARFDADDISEPTRFEKQVAYFNRHPDVVCIGSRVTLIDPLGSPIKVTDHPLDHETIEAGLLRGSGWSIVQPAAMMRTDAVRRVGGYREQFATSSDLDLFLRLSEIGKLANLPEPLVRYRQHFNSIANTKADVQWNLKAQIVGDAYDRRGMKRPDAWPFERRVPKPFDQQLRDWIWAALRAGNPAVARQHAKELIKAKPFAMQTWKTTFCAVRGH